MKIHCRSKRYRDRKKMKKEMQRKLSASARKRRQREKQKQTVSSRKISRIVRKEQKEYGLCREKKYGDNRFEFKEVNLLHAKLTEIMVLKAKKKMDEVKVKSEQLLEEYSLTEISKLTCIDISKVRRILKSHLNEKTPKEYSWKLSDEQTEEVKDFFRSPQISYNLPDMRFCSKRYMRMSIEEAYDIYKAGRTSRVVGRSTFGKLKPRDVVTIDKTPNRQCCCDTCENFRTVILAMKRHGFKGLGANSKKAIEDSMCKCKKIKNTGNTSYEWTKMPRKSCAFRKCKECGSIYEKKRLIKENTRLCTETKTINWKQWMNQKMAKKYNAQGFALKINSKSVQKRSLYEVIMTGTAFDLLSYYIRLLNDISSHHFNNCWQMFQFMLCQSNLQDNQILLIQDFARNFVIDFQDEPKTLHWAHDQVTVHPTICCFSCPRKGCNHLVTVEVIHISTDLNHDPHAVAFFKKDALNYIRSEGISYDEVIEWTDQSPTQYKSRHIFASLANNDIPTCHNYYPVKHGKNPADGASGRVKLTFKRGKLSREATIRNARELFEYTAEAMNKKNDCDGQRCSHFETKILFKGKIRRNNFRDSEAIKDTKKIHSVRSTGVRDWVQIRNTTCCCLSCMCNSGPCQYPEYADEWQWRCMSDTKAVNENLVMTHWRHHVNKEDIKKRVEISKQRLTEFEQKKEKVYIRFMKKEEKKIKKEDEGKMSHDNTSAGTSVVNLHNNVKAEDGKKVVKRKLFDVVKPGDVKVKKQATSFTQVKENARKRKSVEKMEMSDDEDNKENIPINVEILSFQRQDFWTKTHEEMMMQTSFSEAVEYLKCTPFPELKTNFHTVMNASDRVDKISLHLYPPDAPEGLVPRHVIGDGNCLPRTLSLLTFGTEHQNLEIRLRIGREAILFIDKYLDSEFLYKGALNRSVNIDIVEFYALVSPVFNSMKRDEQVMNEDNFRKIYQKEAMSMIADRKWMGMWQIHQFANVVKRPIRVVYPMRNNRTRCEYNRYIYPDGYVPAADQQDELHIMWTSTNNVTYDIDHFVPLLKQGPTRLMVKNEVMTNLHKINGMGLKQFQFEWVPL